MGGKKPNPQRIHTGLFHLYNIVEMKIMKQSGDFQSLRKGGVGRLAMGHMSSSGHIKDPVVK